MKKRREQRRRTQGATRRSGASRSRPPLQNSVLKVLRDAGRPLKLEELKAALGPASAAQADELLDALVRSGDVVLNRRGQYCLREQLPGLTVGTISANRNGDGLLLPDDGSPPVFLAGQQMREVMHGDRVAVRVEGPGFRGRPQGTIVEVLERRTREVVGRLHVETGVAYLVPDNPRVTHRVLVPANALGEARSGQVVIVELTAQPGRNAQPVGRVSRVLGEQGAPGMETDIAIHSHGLPFEFPADVLAEAESYGAESRRMQSQGDGPARPRARHDRRRGRARLR